MKRPELLACVALGVDLPEYRLRKGDVGVVVEVFEPDAVMVEFMDGEGDTVALMDLNDSDVRVLTDDEARTGQHALPRPAGTDVPIADATMKTVPGPPK